MVRIAAPLLALSAVLGALEGTGADDASATPIGKVIDMMDAMLVKGEAAMKEEQVKYSAFVQWCNDQASAKQNDVKDAESLMEELSASIEKSGVSIKKLTERIQELEHDVERWGKDLKSVQEVRAKEAKDYATTQLDYEESIDALGRAIKAISETQGDVPQALLQVSRQPALPDAAREAMGSYLQTLQGSVADESAPQGDANAYESQSQGIVEMLGNLKDDFAQKKRDLEAEELKNRHAEEMVRQQLTDNIENAGNEISKKTGLRGEQQESKARDEGSLEQVTKDRDEDSRYLEEMQAMCEVRAKDFEARQKVRQEELDAINKAMEIIGGENVAGAGETHGMLGLLQVRAARRGHALAQVRSNQQSAAQEQAALFLADASHQAGSDLLAKAAQQVMNNPFRAVKKMIKDLIVKLMEEATSETEHKGFCDAELGTNKQTRDKKTADVAKLHADIEELEAEITQLTQDVEELAGAVRELDASMAKAMEDRMQSKDRNAKTIEEAQNAQAAIESAIAILNTFYEKSAQSAALLEQKQELGQAQSPEEDAPETFGASPYKGMQSEGGGVVGFLEVILGDFTRLESETTAEEAAEQDAFKDFIFEGKKDKALKEGEQEHKMSRRADAQGELQSAKVELQNTQEQLDAAITYYEKLKPTCVDSGVSYEDRVKRREAEIASLQEALKILAGDS